MNVNQINFSGTAKSMKKAETSILLVLAQDEMQMPVQIDKRLYPKHAPIRKGDPVFVTGKLVKAKDKWLIQATCPVINMRPGYAGTVEITEVFAECKEAEQKNTGN